MASSWERSRSQFTARLAKSRLASSSIGLLARKKESPTTTRQAERPAAVVHEIVDSLQSPRGKQVARSGDDQQLAVGRHVVGQQRERLARNILVQQIASELEIARHVVFAVRRVFAVALEKVCL